MNFYRFVVFKKQEVRAIRDGHTRTLFQNSIMGLLYQTSKPITNPKELAHRAFIINTICIAFLCFHIVMILRVEQLVTAEVQFSGAKVQRKSDNKECEQSVRTLAFVVYPTEILGQVGLLRIYKSLIMSLLFQILR